MPEVTRVTRSAYTGKDRDDYYSSDDERSTYSRSHRGGESYRTVQRYRVGPRDDFGDRQSSRLEIVPPRGERIEIDRRSERFVEPDRPRSAIDVRPRSTVVERYVERDGVRDTERSRAALYERDSPRDSDRRPWERSNRPWESDVRETDVQIVKRTTERRDEPYELERYQRETEYYERPEPPPQPIVIRQRAPEPQQIIVQEAPAPPPIVLPRPAEPTYEIIRREETQEVVVPEPRRMHEDEYYYRRDVREFGDRRDEDVQVARYDRRGRDSFDRYSDDEDYVVKRKIVRERSRSSSPNHRRHLAEGALAGAGAAALLAHHKQRQGEPVDHKGRNVVGGAALGAIGAEVLTRARGRYQDSRDGRSRSRSSSRSKVKTGLGLAAAALVTTAAIKYARDRKANKEELARGRSRTRSRRRRRSSRGSYSSYSSVERVTSKHRNPKHRAQSIAKAGAATAAVAGVVEHFRSKSRRRDGSRSKSRIRTGAEIVGSGLAGAAVAGLYENRKAKEEEEAESVHIRRERRRSRSRARSLGAYSDPGVDPELGMVQYGTEPVYQQTTTTTNYYDGSSDGATRRRSRRRGHSLSDSRSRSRSRVRDIAGAAAGTAAAAIGINQYQRRKEKKERERERERRRYEEEPPENYYARSYDDGYSPSPPHASGGSHYPDQPVFAPPPGGVTNINISTPHVAQPPIPPYNPQDYAAPPGANYGYPATATRGTGNNVSSEPRQSSPFGNIASCNVPFQGHASTAADLLYFPPPPTSPLPENTADQIDRAEEAPLRSPSITSSTDTERPHNRSVTFAPLSPTSSRRLHILHKQAEGNPDTIHTSAKGSALPHHTSTRYNPSEPDSESLYDRNTRPGHKRRRRRRNSDPSSDRPYLSSKHRRRQPPKTSLSRDSSPAARSDESEVEILPDRFDDEGRPLDKYGNRFGGASSRAGGSDHSEMVENIVKDVGDVVDGKKTWMDLLRGVVADAAGAAGDSGSDGSRRRR